MCFCAGFCSANTPTCPPNIPVSIRGLFDLLHWAALTCYLRRFGKQHISSKLTVSRCFAGRDARRTHSTLTFIFSPSRAKRTSSSAQRTQTVGASNSSLVQERSVSKLCCRTTCRKIVGEPGHHNERWLLKTAKNLCEQHSRTSLEAA